MSGGFLFRSKSRNDDVDFALAVDGDCGVAVSGRIDALSARVCGRPDTDGLSEMT